MPLITSDCPYIVSEDIHILLAEWAHNKGFILPSGEFFTHMRKEMMVELSKIFGVDNVLMISTDEISKGIKSIVNSINPDNYYPVVSLDNVYYRSDFSIQMNRAVDHSYSDVGVVPRHGHPGLDHQIAMLVSRGITKIIIVDDVLFSGASMISLVELLEAHGIAVESIVSGIAMSDAINDIEKRIGVKVISWSVFDSVIDEVCERDFYPGVPYSGRYLHLSNNVGLSYVHPIGDPVAWASIPDEHRAIFSIFCLNQTSKLFSEISRLSNKDVLYKDIDRKLPDHLAGNKHLNPYHLLLLELKTY